MNILIAPNSMKGSLNALEFAEIIEKAFIDSSMECSTRKIPVADGGDFTGEIVSKVIGAKPIYLKVTGPLGDSVNAKYWVSGNIAIIEMAEASGMKKVLPVNLNPLKASSFGTGELILDACKNGCSEIWLAIGGSATVDGGSGMIEALGFQLFDKNGIKLKGNGGNLNKISRIKKTNLPGNISFKIICDVNNPLLGKNGAATVFGPQKGAIPKMVDTLEKGLKNWQELLFLETGRNFASNGFGAAGGIALPLVAFFDATLEMGASFVLNILDFEKHVKWSDMVITGEGKIDSQTNNYKAPFAVAQMARKCNKPVYAFAGSKEGFSSTVFDGIFTLTGKLVTKEKAIENASELLYKTVLKFANLAIK